MEGRDRAFDVVNADVNTKTDKKEKDEDSELFFYSEVNKQKKRKKPEQAPVFYSEVDKTKNKDKRNKDEALNDSEECEHYAEVDRKTKKEKKRDKKLEFKLEPESKVSISLWACFIRELGRRNRCSNMNTVSSLSVSTGSTCCFIDLSMYLLD